MAEAEHALSLKERIILANQFRILEKVDEDYASEHARKAQVLEQGFEGQYGIILGRFAENQLSVEDCCLVEKTLLLHSWLSDWSDKPSIDVSEFSQVGFDANSEWHHLQYAQFLYELNPAGYPGVIAVVDVHRPTLGRWRDMVSQWESKKHRTVTEADVARILSAGHYHGV